MFCARRFLFNCLLLFFALILFLSPLGSANADIYQWEWIDPTHPELGKKQSTTLCPGGAGIDPMPGVFLGSRDLTQAYLIGADLSNASCSLPCVNLTDADLTLANLTSADFYVSKLINANFTQANLTKARLGYSNLTGAIFTNAKVLGADFSVSMNIGPNGFTFSQLQTTANYKIENLSGIKFIDSDLSGWDFHYQNLTNAYFNAATLTGTILDGADTRGARGIYYTTSSTINTIRFDGTIQGLSLSSGKTLLVRNYEGDPSRNLSPIPVIVQNSMSMGSNGIIQMVFDQDTWYSKISFTPGILVSRGGILNLTFADGVDVSSEVGRTFSLFDWSGVSPTGTFDVQSPFVWDLSNIYTTGDVTLLAVPEPGVVRLLGMGALILFGYGWRRKISRILPIFLVALAVLVALPVLGTGIARADVFNMPGGMTSLEMVTVGNPGNAPDTVVMKFDRTTGYGEVDYTYQIGKFEITAGQYTAFLNAVAKTDAYGLYNPEMDIDATSSVQGCNIKRTGSAGNYVYSVPSDWANRPVNDVSWGDAARFVNWISNGQPIGAQGLSTTENGSYYLNGATSKEALNAVVRKPNATWVIPSVNEWYKAAYHKNDGVTGNYWLYATASDDLPSNVLSEPDPGNNANFYQGQGRVYTIGSPYYRTPVGTFANSESPYGTFDQEGNVREWLETKIRYSWGETPLARGGSYQSTYTELQASYLDFIQGGVGMEYSDLGFRIAYVPEPGSFILLGTGILSLLAGRLFKRKSYLPGFYR